MKVVVLGAGIATRMEGKYPNKPKGLIKIAKRELVYRAMKFLRDEGFNNFIIVTNPMFEKAYREYLQTHGFNGRIILNNHPEKGNGYSFYLAREHAGERFIVIMTDHIYERTFIKKAIQGSGLIIDRVGLYIDHREATKVKLRNNRISDIGKNLNEFDAFDTGFFILKKEIFAVAETLIKTKECVELSEIIKKSSIEVTEISGLFWADADTPKEIKRLKRLIVKQSVKRKGDGWVSRLINRKISTLLSTSLCERISPDVMTWLSFLIGIASALLAFLSAPIGGIVYQLSSVLDGIDGEIARATLRESNFGGWLDSLLDRIIDFVFLLALYDNIPHSYGYIYACAIFGVVMVSYSTERFKGAFGTDAYESITPLRYLPGKRDERVFATMILCLMGLIKTLIILLAIVTNIRVLLTIYFVWKWDKK